MAARSRQKQALRQRILEAHQDDFWAVFRSQRGLRHAATAFAALAMVIGALGLTMAASGEALVQTLPYRPSSSATALCLLLLGLAVIMLFRGTHLAFRVACLAAWVTLGLCILRLLEYAFGLQLYVSRLFIAPDPLHPIRMGMGLPSVAALTIAALAILLSRARGLDRPVFPFGTTVIIIGSAFVLGYVYGHPVQAERFVPQMTLPSAIGLMSVGIALLLFAVAREVALTALIDQQLEVRQRELEELTRQLEALIQHAASGIIFFGPDGSIERINRAAAAMLAYSPEMVAAGAPIPLEELTIIDEAGQQVTLEQTAIYRALHGEPVFGMVVNVAEAGHAGVWMSVSAVPIRDEDGALTGVVTVLTDITDLHETRSEAWRLTQELQSILDNAPSGIVFYDREARIIRFNQAARDLLDYQEEDFSLPPAERYQRHPFHNEAGELANPAAGIMAAAHQGEVIQGEVVSLQTSRGLVWISISAGPTRDARGELTGAVVVLTDITALHNTRAEARRLADELQSILDNAPAGIIFYDRQGNIIRLNQAARDILGYTDEDIAMPAAERFRIHQAVDEGGQPISPTTGATAAALRGATVVNEIALFRRTRRGPVWISVSAGPTRGPSGEPTGVVAILSDVTALHQAQEEVRRAGEYSEQQRAELETILASIADGVMVVAKDGTLERSNRAASEIMRGYADERLGKHVLLELENIVEITGEDEQAVLPDDLPVSRAIRGEVVENALLKLTWRDGVARWLSVSAAPVIAPDNEIDRVVLIYRDVTAEREHQQELERLVNLRTAALQRNQARLRALGADLANAEQRERQRLAAAIHDEVAQTLGAIKMHLEILGRTHPDAAEDLARVSAMVAEANAQSRAIMTELSPPVLQRIGLAEALRWWAGEVARQHPIQVTVSQDGAFDRLEPYVETTLFQSVKELLQNAVKHAHASSVTVHLRCDNELLEITVVDDGTGFDPAVMESGTLSGFGLFSIRERLAYLGGEFIVESAPDHGTRAALRLPLHCEPVATPARAQEAAPSAR